MCQNEGLSKIRFMARPPTTVHLTELAQKVKIKYANTYGLRNILSAGLILFDQLESDQRERAVMMANGDKDFDGNTASKRALPGPANRPKSQAGPRKTPKTGQVS